MNKEAFAPDLEQQFARMAPDQRCRMAEVKEDARLYISNPKLVDAYYRDCRSGGSRISPTAKRASTAYSIRYPGAECGRSSSTTDARRGETEGGQYLGLTGVED
jgi:hypothetical protein